MGVVNKCGPVLNKFPSDTQISILFQRIPLACILIRLQVRGRSFLFLFRSYNNFAKAIPDDFARKINFAINTTLSNELSLSKESETTRETEKGEQEVRRRVHQKNAEKENEKCTRGKKKFMTSAKAKLKSLLRKICTCFYAQHGLWIEEMGKKRRKKGWKKYDLIFDLWSGGLIRAQAFVYLLAKKKKSSFFPLFFSFYFFSFS